MLHVQSGSVHARTSAVGARPPGEAVARLPTLQARVAGVRVPQLTLRCAAPRSDDDWS